jgi:hypothetical protein
VDVAVSDQPVLDLDGERGALVRLLVGERDQALAEGSRLRTELDDARAAMDSAIRAAEYLEHLVTGEGAPPMVWRSRGAAPPVEDALRGERDQMRDSALMYAAQVADLQADRDALRAQVAEHERRREVEQRAREWRSARGRGVPTADYIRACQALAAAVGPPPAPVGALPSPAKCTCPWNNGYLREPWPEHRPDCPATPREETT